MSRKSIPFHVGRIIFGLALIAMGYFIFFGGHHVYDKYLHALRKQFLPESQGSHKPFGLAYSYEQIN